MRRKKKDICKNEERILEPEYYNSKVNIPVLNYKVYYMSRKEKMLYFILAFVVGAAVAYLFYGGLCKDEFGNATITTYILNSVFCCGLGYLAGKAFLRIRTHQIMNKRKQNLSRQFRDMLDGLTTALGAGNNIPDSFASVYKDLKIQYDDSDYIVQELKVILAGLQNSVAIEELLYDFGCRSGIEDIVSFADVFNISYRKGGNINEIIRNTHAVLSDKMAIREEIETMVASNKNDTMLMVGMPIFLVAFIKVSSPDFADNFATISGVLSTTIGVVCFVVAYIISSKLLDIKI